MHCTCIFVNFFRFKNGKKQPGRTKVHTLYVKIKCNSIIAALIKIQECIKLCYSCAEMYTAWQHFAIASKHNALVLFAWALTV